MGFLDIRNVTKSYGQVEVLHRVDIAVEEASSWSSSALGLREVHASEHDRGAGRHLGRRDRHQGPRGERRPPVQAQHRDGVPKLRALPQHDCGPEHDLRAGNARRSKSDRDRALAEVASSSRSTTSSTASPASSPAASASAWQWAGRSSATPTSSSSTNRSQTSTPSSASTCVPRSRSSPEAQDHHRLRHPRPDRGDDAVHPHRRDEQGLRPAARHPQGNLRHPANVFVATFMGSPAMNIVPAKVVIRDGQPHAALTDADGTPSTSASPRTCVPGRAGTSSSAFARGDHRPRGADRKSANIVALRNRVTVTEPAGADTFVTMTL